MALLRRIAAALFAVCLAAAMVGTGACSHPAKPPVEAPRPKPRNAAELAAAIVGAKVLTIVYTERARGHQIADKIGALEQVRDTLEGTGIDPVRDVDRACIASKGIARGDLAMAVAQHKLTDQQLKASLDTMIARSDPPGAWIDVGVPAARVTIRGKTRIIALVEPGFVAILPESLAQEAKRLAGTGGFPDPKGHEVAITLIADPSNTLKVEPGPAIPPTMRTAKLEARIAADEGVDLLVEGQSTDEGQATADAAALTEAVERATTLKISIVRVHLFKPVPFRADGSLVKTEVHLSPGEIDTLMRMMPK
jgi:hypothetical protein